MSDIVNAKITDTTISMADHGCLTFNLYLEGRGWCVAYGGYAIGSGYLGADTFNAKSGAGLEAMMRIMDVVGVERWENLKGKFVRVKDVECGKQIDTIGNLIEDRWFNIREFFTEKTN